MAANKAASVNFIEATFAKMERELEDAPQMEKEANELQRETARRHIEDAMARRGQ